MIAISVIGAVLLPPIFAWRFGILGAIVCLAATAYGLHLHAQNWQRAHRAAVHARPPVDYVAMSSAERADARTTAGAITGEAKIVGWLPIAAPILAGALVIAVRRYQGSGSTTSPDASK